MPTTLSTDTKVQVFHDFTGSRPDKEGVGSERRRLSGHPSEADSEPKSEAVVIVL